jgi:hypothetical protein
MFFLHFHLRRMACLTDAEVSKLIAIIDPAQFASMHDASLLRLLFKMDVQSESFVIVSQQFGELLREEPDNTVAHFEYALFLHAHGHSTLASASLNHVLDIDPKFVSAKCSLDRLSSGL